MATTTRKISHDDAHEALQTFVDWYFRNPSGRKVQISIPARPDDTDVILSSYIQQQRESEASA